MIRIRELRKHKCITMKKLGEIIGVSESCVSQYENGKREPDNNTLIKLSDYFGVSVDYLLGSNTNNKTLNKRLKLLLMETEDYSHFAKAIGVTVNDVIMWLKGISFSCYDKISEISDYFNVSVDYLSGKTDDPKYSPLDTQLSDVDFALWSESRDMTEEEKQDIIDYIKFKKMKRSDENE